MFVKPCARRQRGTQEMPVPLSGVYTMEALREKLSGKSDAVDTAARYRSTVSSPI